jgi:hypothetical protein
MRGISFEKESPCPFFFSASKVGLGSSPLLWGYIVFEAFLLLMEF